MNSAHCSRCVCGVCVCVVHLDGSNTEKHISLLVILCIIVYVTNKTIMVKCLNIRKNTDISVDL